VVAVWATEPGFADPSAMDIDSTVQEANIAYPSDAHLMVKMTFLVHKVWTYMKQNIAFFADFLPCVDVKAVKAKARAFYVAAVVKPSCLFFSPRYFLDTVSHRAEPPYGFLWRAALPLPMPLYRFGFSNRSIPADRFLGACPRINAYSPLISGQSYGLGVEMNTPVISTSIAVRNRRFAGGVMP